MRYWHQFDFVNNGDEYIICIDDENLRDQSMPYFFIEDIYNGIIGLKNLLKLRTASQNF